MHTAVKSGCKVFSYGLAGSNILLSDCIQACTSILCSKKLQVVGIMRSECKCEVRVQICEVKVQISEIRVWLVGQSVAFSSKLLGGGGGKVKG